jgi:TolA-binding protein
MVGEVAHARAELAELRHRCISTDAQLAETHRQLDQATSELAELRKELETTMGLLEQQTKNTMEALAQRDEARVLAAQGRAAGRSEAAQILMERFEPELFDADGNGKGLLETYQCGEETATRWVPEKVREMFDVPPLGGAMGSRSSSICR